MARKSYEEANHGKGSGKGAGDALRARLSQKKQTEQPDWGRIDANLIWKAIQAATNDDGAIMFGYSRDGGAYSIKVYAGGEPMKEYMHYDAEVEEFLHGILEVFDGTSS